MMSQNLGSRIPSIVKLNVGGSHFTTSLQTLTRDPNSMLAAMFSGRHEVETTEDGSFFIDRDGTYFRFILNYLRNGELILPEGAKFLEELEVEARFYQVQRLLDELKVARALKVFEKSVILTDRDFRNVLIRWIPMEFILAGEWRLLFRASRDGFTGSAFHSRCDNKGPTVTVVNSNGNIFGGFTENAWTGRGEWVSCRHGFLFSFVNPSGLEPTKLSLITGNEGHGIYCHSSYGPVFGRTGAFGFGVSAAHDLCISYNTNWNSSSSCLGHTYQLPPGQQSTFITGAQTFTVTDYEVFGLSQ